AVLSPNRARFLGGRRMPRRFLPVKNVYRAGIDAGAVGDAQIIIDGHRGTVDSKLRRRVHRAPNVVGAAFALTDNGAVLHKFGINRCYHGTSSSNPLYENRRIP